MKTIKIGKYDWYLIKEIADKTFLFAKDNVCVGYFDDKSNKYETSKISNFLNSVFLQSLSSPDFNIEKITNGIWPITPIQYENYVKNNCPPVTQPFLLRTQGASENLVQAVMPDGSVNDVDITSKTGIRPGFMLDTEYVKELLNKAQGKQTNDTVFQSPPSSQPNETDVSSPNTPSIVQKNETEKRQNTAERIKPPILNVSEQKNISQPQKQNPQNDNNNNNNNANSNNNGPKNPQHNNNNKNKQQNNKQKQNPQNQQQKKKPQKKSPIETAKPINGQGKQNQQSKRPQNSPITKKDAPSVFETDVIDLDYLTAAEFDIEEAMQKVTPASASSEAPSQKDNIEETKVENTDTQKEVSPEETVPQTVVPEIIQEEEPYKNNVLDEDIVIIPTTQVIEEKDKNKTKNTTSNTVPAQKAIQSPFANPSQNQGKGLFKRNPKTHNETFNNTTQHQAKKGQSAIMSKLGAIDTPTPENSGEMTSAIATYTKDTANTQIKKQSSPSAYSQEMSDINQFTIDQLKEIVIKRNRQIAKLKVSVIEITAEHEALMEKISTSRTELEKCKAEQEKLLVENEELQKLIKKSERVANEEKDEMTEEYKKANAKLQAQFMEASQKIEEYNAKVSELTESVNRLEKAAKEKEALYLTTMKQLEEEVQKYKALAENHPQQSDKINSQLKQAEETINEYKAKEIDWEKIKASLEAENEASKNYIATLKQELETKPEGLVEEMSTEEKERLNNLESENIELKADMIKSLRIAKKLSEDLAQESEKAKMQSQTIKELTEKLNELQSDVEMYKKDVAQYKSSCEESHQKFIHKQGELAEAKEKNEQLQGIIGSNGIMIQNLNSEVESLKKTNVSLDNDLNKKTLVIEALNDENKKKDEKIKQLIAEVAEAKEKLSTSASNEERVKELEALCAKQKKEIEEKNARLKRITNDLDESLAGLDAFKKSIFGNE